MSDSQDNSPTSQSYDSSSVTIKFPDGGGFNFRNTIGQLCKNNSTAVFHCYPKSIKYIGANPKGTMCNYLELFAREMGDYRLNIPEGQECVLLRLRLQDLFSFIKSVQKKDSLSLHKPANSRDLLICIKKGGDGATSEFINTIRLLDSPGDVETEYDFGDDEEEGKPNCAPPAREFTKMCTTMKSVKCSYVHVYGYEDGVIFKGYLEDGSCGSTNIFGKPDNQPKIDLSTEHVDKIWQKIKRMEEKGIVSEIENKTSTQNSMTSMKVETSVISSLSKINSLTDKGTAKIYVRPDKTLKILCNVGMFGYLRTYIAEDEEHEEGDE